MSRKVDAEWARALSQRPAPAEPAEPAPVDAKTARTRRMRVAVTLLVAAVLLTGWTVGVVLTVRSTEPNIREVPAGETDWGAVGENVLEEQEERFLDAVLWIAWFIGAALITYTAVKLAQRQADSQGEKRH